MNNNIKLYGKNYMFFLNDLVAEDKIKYKEISRFLDIFNLENLQINHKLFVKTRGQGFSFSCYLLMVFLIISEYEQNKLILYITNESQVTLRSKMSEIFEVLVKKISINLDDFSLSNDKTKIKSLKNNTEVKVIKNNSLNYNELMVIKPSMIIYDEVSKIEDIEKLKTIDRYVQERSTEVIIGIDQMISSVLPTNIFKKPIKQIVIK